MPSTKAKGQGPKTHEQFARNLERKDDVPKERETAALEGETPTASKAMRRRDARQSEMPVSERGMHQESDHNKHNKPGQTGHKPQQHSPAEEKH
jgi:hypothetical protein